MVFYYLFFLLIQLTSSFSRINVSSIRLNTIPLCKYAFSIIKAKASSPGFLIIFASFHCYRNYYSNCLKTTIATALEHNSSKHHYFTTRTRTTPSLALSSANTSSETGCSKSNIVYAQSPLDLLVMSVMLIP